MVKTGNSHVWAKIMTLIGAIGSWLVVLPVVINYLTGRDILISSYDGLVMISLSLAIIGFISAIETLKDAPFKEIIGLRGVTSTLMAACIVSSCLMIIGLSIILLTPDF